MTLPIDVSFTFTEREYVRAIRRGVTQHPFTSALAIFATLATLAALACSLSRTPGPGFILWSTAAVLSFLYFFYLLVLRPANSYVRLPQAVRETHLRYRFTTTGAELKTDQSQSHWDWPIFTHFSEDEASFWIFFRSRQATILIPKRAFASGEAVDTLRALLKEKLRVW